MAQADSNRRQSWVRGSTLGVAILLGAVLLGMVNYLGGKYYTRGDWTSSGLYTLSEKSENLLSRLQQPIEFIVFLSPDNPLYRPTQELLERYAAASQEVTVREIDPVRDLVQAQKLVDQYQVDRQNVVVVASGNDRRVIDASDLAEWDFSGMQQGLPEKLKGFRGEQAFSGAILELTEATKPTLAFTTGHGERGIDDSSPEGLSELKRLLGADNFSLESWAPLTQPDVPKAASLVVVAGPKVAFLPSELEALDRYLDRGGRVLLLLDPQLAEGANPDLGMASWLEKHSIRLGDDIVVDPDRAILFSGLETFSVDSYGTHPVTDSFRQAGVPVLWSLARSVTPETGDQAVAGDEATTLLRTSSSGFGETNLAALPDFGQDDADTPGPVSLAVAVEGPVAQAAQAATGSEKPETPADDAQADLAGSDGASLDAGNPDAAKPAGDAADAANMDDGEAASDADHW
ncbi:MAG: GldG family protein, partial [Acidobacteria bacterium]|nr:GldG family protein [Acidobacteriota bacterium]